LGSGGTAPLILKAEMPHILTSLYFEFVEIKVDILVIHVNRDAILVATLLV